MFLSICIGRVEVNLNWFDLLLLMQVVRVLKCCGLMQKMKVVVWFSVFELCMWLLVLKVCRWLLLVLVLLFIISGVLFGWLKVFCRCCVVLVLIIWDRVLCRVVVIFEVIICWLRVVFGVKCVLQGVFRVKLRCFRCRVGMCMLLLMMIFISLVSVVGWLLELFRVVVQEGIR